MLGFHKLTAKVAWTVALVAISLFSIYAIRKTLFIFLLAVFFAYIVYPAVQRLAQYKPRRLSHSGATALVFAMILVFMAAAVTIIGPAIADQASHLAEKLPSLVSDPHLLNRIPLPSWLEPYRVRAGEFLQGQFQSGNSAALPIAKQIGAFTLTFAGNSVFVILIPILAFLLVKDASEMRKRFFEKVTHTENGKMWVGILDGLDVVLGRYIRSLLILSAATLIVYSIFFSIAGVPYSLVLAALAGILEFVPVVGPLSAAAVCLVVAGLAGYDHLLVLVGFIALYRLFQDYVLNPYLMSDGLEMAPLLVLFGLLAGEEIGGVVGIFLSVPALAAAKIVASQIAEAVNVRRTRAPTNANVIGPK